MRLATTKTSLYEDISNLRFHLRRADKAIARGDWDAYEDIMTTVESLASASRWAARENNGGAE